MEIDNKQAHKKVYIGNIPFFATEKDVIEVCNIVGPGTLKYYFSLQ